MIFTALPLIVKACLEQDVNYVTDGENLKPYFPKLYYVGQKGTIFNWTNYFIWIITGIVHSAIVFFIPYYVFAQDVLLK
jgi:magnesium-transporting ATPase (P-type)